MTTKHNHSVRGVAMLRWFEYDRQRIRFLEFWISLKKAKIMLMWAKVSLHAKSKKKVLCHPFEIVQELFELKLTTILWHFIQGYFISIFVPNLVEIGPMVWGKTTYTGEGYAYWINRSLIFSGRFVSSLTEFNPVVLGKRIKIKCLRPYQQKTNFYLEQSLDQTTLVPSWKVQQWEGTTTSPLNPLVVLSFSLRVIQNVSLWNHLVVI